MKRDGSMTLIATLFLLLIVATLTFQMQSFKSEQQQKRLLIDNYQNKINRIK